MQQVLFFCLALLSNVWIEMTKKGFQKLQKYVFSIQFTDQLPRLKPVGKSENPEG